MPRLLAAGGVSAADGAPRWVEVRAPHFTVYSDAGPKQARQVAWQFEEVREPFHLVWPWARLDHSRPILILAVKDESGLKTLLPEFWEKKGSVRPAGIFASGEDHHYIALRTELADAFESWQENPYHLVSAARSDSDQQAALSFLTTLVMPAPPPAETAPPAEKPGPSPKTTAVLLPRAGMTAPAPVCEPRRGASSFPWPVGRPAR